MRRQKFVLKWGSGHRRSDVIRRESNEIIDTRKSTSVTPYKIHLRRRVDERRFDAVPPPPSSLQLIEAENDKERRQRKQKEKRNNKTKQNEIEQRYLSIDEEQEREEQEPKSPHISNSWHCSKKKAKKLKEESLDKSSTVSNDPQRSPLQPQQPQQLLKTTENQSQPSRDLTEFFKSLWESQ